MFSTFLVLSCSFGNLAKLTNVLIATKGDVLYVNSLSTKGNFILIMANKTVSDYFFKGKGKVSNLSCADLPIYKHSTFRTNLLINGKGKFPYPAMSSFDLLLVDCDNQPFDENDESKLPEISYFTDRTLTFVTIIFFIELVIVINYKTKFMHDLHDQQRLVYTGHQTLDYIMTFTAVVDAVWIFMAFLKINDQKADMDDYYHGFFMTKMVAIVVVAFVDVSGFPAIDAPLKIEFLPLLFFAFIALTRQKTSYAWTILLLLSWIPIYVFKLHADKYSDKVAEFSVHLNTNDRELFALIEKKGLATLPFDIQKQFKIIGIAAVALLILIPFIERMGFWQELEALSLSTILSYLLKFTIEKVTSIEGIVLEKLVPSMLMEEDE